MNTIRRKLILILAMAGFAGAALAGSASQLRAADTDGPICKVHPQTKICNQPYTKGCDCVDS